MVISGRAGFGALGDDALARAAKRGDRAAAGEFFARHQRYLLVAARSIGGARLDPEDLLSGTSPGLRALRQLAIGYGAAAVTYLLGLAFGAVIGG